jgi:hypothetical protein
MPPDPVKSEDARAWLARAAADLRAARNELAADDPVLGDVVFHCQQAVEKAMKAFLTWHDVPFRKTHDLGVLGGQCAEIDGSLTDIMRRAAPMTEYAWKFPLSGGRVRAVKGRSRRFISHGTGSGHGDHVSASIRGD